MGCDIHLVLEKRHGSKWIGVDTFSGDHRAKWMLKPKEYDWSSPVARDRNYDRFAALAGVRGSGPEPRGIPADASDTTAYLVEDYGSDGHGHSWLPMKEASEVWKRTAGQLDEIESKYPDSYFFGVDTSEGSNNNSDDYRIVFWFDN